MTDTAGSRRKEGQMKHIWRKPSEGNWGHTYIYRHQNWTLVEKVPLDHLKFLNKVE